MTPSSCVLMAQYNRWMNERLYDAAAKLTEEQVFEDRGAFFGSLFDTLNHLCVADTIWMHRFAQHPDFGWLAEQMAGFPVPSSLTQRMASSLAGLREYRTNMDALIGEFAACVTPQQLASTLRYKNTKGEPHAKSFGGVAQHLFNHQTHHRGQSTTLLTQMGIDVGSTDLHGLLPNEEG